jgi:hypothetical protein
MERTQQSWASDKGEMEAVHSRNSAGEQEEAEAIDEILPDL